MDSGSTWVELEIRKTILRRTGPKRFNVMRGYDREGFVVEEKTATNDEEVDDEYLPACCRNGKEHRHPV